MHDTISYRINRRDKFFVKISPLTIFRFMRLATYIIQRIKKNFYQPSKVYNLLYELWSETAPNLI